MEGGVVGHGLLSYFLHTYTCINILNFITLDVSEFKYWESNIYGSRTKDDEGFRLFSDSITIPCAYVLVNGKSFMKKYVTM